MEGAAASDVIARAQDLSDIELAALLCLIADQHCIIEADLESQNEVVQELQIIAARTFGLTSALLECSEATTLDDFGHGVLTNAGGVDSYFDARHGSRKEESQHSSEISRVAFRSSQRRSPGFITPLDDCKIANVVIAKNLNLASEQVQIQALDLVRGRRVYTRTSVHAAPKRFLLIALLETDSPRLTSHLNDQLFISHVHNSAEDDLVNLQELAMASSWDTGNGGDDASSNGSVIRTPLPDDRETFVGRCDANRRPLFSAEDVGLLMSLVGDVRMSAEIRAYMHNIIVFLRLHRAVGGGVSALASRHVDALARALAPLHGLTYVPPSLVALATRKVYAHRIVLTNAANERSIQWGSSAAAVESILEGVTAVDVIEEVLHSVEAPL